MLPLDSQMPLGTPHIQMSESVEYHSQSSFTYADLPMKPRYFLQNKVQLIQSSV